MGYDWHAIRAQDRSEMAFYRLLGEMLRRRATRADLDRVRGFLGTVRPGVEAWHSLGEALFHTTRGSSDGFRIWCSWARTIDGHDYEESQHLAAWQRFRRDLSETLDETSDVGLAESTDADGEPPTIQFEPIEIEDAELDFEVDSNESTRVLDPTGPPSTVLIERDVMPLESSIPSGPHTIRYNGEVYDGVDASTLVTLLRRGVLFGVDVLMGGRWVGLIDHPAFAALVGRLNAQAEVVLGATRRIQTDATQPGV